MKALKMMFAAALLPAAILLNGCEGVSGLQSDDPFAMLSAEQTAVGLVVASRTDFPRQDIDVLEPYLKQVAYGGGKLVLTVSDGRPADNQQIFSQKNLADACRGKETAYTTKLLRKEIIPLGIAVQGAAAKAEDSATLEAIRETVRNMGDVDGRKALIVLDNGIQTTGNLAMTSAVFDSGKLLDSLEQTGNIPDLTGISVDWYGLGEVSPGLYDRDLSETERRCLREFWEGLCTRAGAASVCFHEENNRADKQEERTLPAVRKITLQDSTVPIPEVTEYVPDEPEDNTVTTTVDMSGGLKFGEKTAMFLPNSTELADEPATIEALIPVAGQLRLSGQSIILIGTIATVPSKDQGISFSKGRAEKIRDILISLGVPGESIYTAGAGFTEKGILTDEDTRSDGTLDPEIAARNRAVWLFTADNADWAWLIQKYMPT